MSSLHSVRTEILDIGYELEGPESGAPVIFVHGWPDDARAWKGVVPHLARQGFRTYAPYLRGYGPSRFRSKETMRDGRAVALAQDVIDFTDALGIGKFALVGHDWGGRIAYTLAALYPERLSSITSISVQYSPKGKMAIPDFEQSRLYWYQWFLNFDPGAETFRRDPKAFARAQWETWGPPGWFTDREFEEAAESFSNPDFVDVVISSYRSRWRPVPGDARYDALQEKLGKVDKLKTPTLVIHGSADGASLAKSTEDQQQSFEGHYQRVELPGVGHFVPREVPEKVADLVIPHVKQYV